MQSGVFAADIGTSSFKAALISSNGTVLGFKRIFFPPEVHAADWSAAFVSAWMELTASCEVAAVCISGNGPTFVSVSHGACPCDSACKERSLSEDAATALIENAKRHRLFLWNEPIPPSMPQSAGASLFLPRLDAFQQAYPHSVSKQHTILSGPEYLAFILTGNAVTVLPDSRYQSVYWNVQDVEKDPLYAGMLPDFVLLGTEIGRFCTVPVIAGAPDFIAALIGSNTLTAGTACDRAGSSEGINVCIKEPCRAEQTLLLPSVIPQLWNVSFLIPDSGVSFAHFLTGEGFLPHEYRACMEYIAAEPPRFVEDYPDTSGGRGRLFVEQLGFRLRCGFDILEQVSGYRPVYNLSGGQARNPVWCRIKAAITGRTFALPHFADAELLGNAAVAYHALGGYADLTAAAAQMSTMVRLYEPEPHVSALYSEKYEHWKEKNGINV